ncbi:PLP-dependent cysteine synthase family protein [Pseudomonas folii]|uniref:L-cysteine desulfhydrase Cds1 n=1 Tax=Pseudomonas folii TaxID=2762593 RepID=A0ABR7B7F1_9PSED|nr:PLP-dependent cysteine synthase family protein [Pseudomonas folii]MBC3953084.1 PLP-dependent cysteine synthase family protein [Pseudomonas folii]
MHNWIRNAIKTLDCDQRRSADTHMLKLDVPALGDIDIYIKDESTHPSGSLKHRLARSLFLHAICSGKIRQGTHVVEASSGSTAVSEAYFAKLLGLPFTAVMPRHTASKKIQQVELLGGRCHFVEQSCDMYSEAERLALLDNGHYMDQFTYAERATDWRGNNNIADSIFDQLSGEAHPIPTAIVMSAGTGGTSSTIGRFIRYKGHATKLIVVDPENSVFYDSYRSGDAGLTSLKGSRIEGIGRPRVEASFLPGVIDDMLQIPDAASIATLGWLEKLIGKKPGGSTGTNVWGALKVALDMQAQGLKGSVVTLMCDSGERYLDTYYDPEWVERTIGDLSPYTKKLERLLIAR